MIECLSKTSKKEQTHFLDLKTEFGYYARRYLAILQRRHPNISKVIEMKKPVFLLIGILALCARGVEAQTTNVSAADQAAIKQTALDYIEGWYEGNAERMERALHPELAKRIARTNPQNGQSRLDQMSALSLVQGTRRGGGKATPEQRRQKDVTILDVYENAASVKVVASDWIDYLHVAKFNGRWVIVNVLWELKPDEK